MAAAIMTYSVSPSERRRITIARQEEILEAMIWAGANLAVPDIVASRPQPVCCRQGSGSVSVD